MVTRKVELSVFDLLDAFIVELSRGGLTPEDTISDTSEIIQFFKTFFSQFLRAEVKYKVKSFSPQEALAIRNMRLKLDPQSQQPVRDVLAQFEEFTDIYPDVVYTEYEP